MSVYYCLEQDWEKIEEFWTNEFPEEFKDETVFQMEPFPKHGPKRITFISNEGQAVQLVIEKFGLKESESWTSVGSQGLKRLTGENSSWKNIPMKKIIEYAPMTKEELKKTLIRLNELYSDFRSENSVYEKGKNKKIRDTAYNNLKNTIQVTKSYVWKIEELMELLCEGDTSDFGRAIIMDEFSSPTYYDKDMARLIRDVQDKINQME